MKQKVTKEAVAQTMEELVKQGKKPTLQAIYQVLNAGSMSTIQRFKAELEAEATAEQDSDEALAIFRQMWGLALAEAKKLREDAIAEMSADIAALATGNERIEAANESLAAKLTAAQDENQRLAGELSKAHTLIVDLQQRAAADKDAHHAQALEFMRLKTLMESNASAASPTSK